MSGLDTQGQEEVSILDGQVVDLLEGVLSLAGPDADDVGIFLDGLFEDEPGVDAALGGCTWQSA